MAEKKKRWRPSLTAYRELEETVHRQCVELDAWRDKYRSLADGKAVGGVSQAAYEELQRKYDDQLLADSHLSGQVRELEECNRSMKEELERLGSRGFWSRLFNR